VCVRWVHRLHGRVTRPASRTKYAKDRPYDPTSVWPDLVFCFLLLLLLQWRIKYQSHIRQLTATVVSTGWVGINFLYHTDWLHHRDLLHHRHCTIERLMSHKLRTLRTRLTDHRALLTLTLTLTLTQSMLSQCWLSSTCLPRVCYWLKTKFLVFTVRCYDSMVYAVVCVCVSHSGILSKRLNLGLSKQCSTIANRIYTVSEKKQDTTFLSLTSANANRFSISN